MSVRGQPKLLLESRGAAAVPELSRGETQRTA